MPNLANYYFSISIVLFIAFSISYIGTKPIFLILSLANIACIAKLKPLRSASDGKSKITSRLILFAHIEAKCPFTAHIIGNSNFTI